MTSLEPAELERRIGLPPGPVLTELVAQAYALDSTRPTHAFEDGLALILPWIGPAPAHAERASWSAQVLVLGIGHQLTEFGLLLDRRQGKSSDAYPVVYRAPKADDPTPHVLAPDLVSFLGLVALVGVESMSRFWSDDEWRKQHGERTGDAEARKRFKRAAQALRKISGVRIPASPSSVARAEPDLDGAPVAAPSAPRFVAPPDYEKVLREGREACARGDHDTARERLTEVTERWLMPTSQHALDEWRELSTLLTSSGIPESAPLHMRIRKKISALEKKSRDPDFF